MSNKRHGGQYHYHSTPRGYRRYRSAQPRAVGVGNGSSKGTQTKRLVMLAKWNFPLTSITVYQDPTEPVLFPSARSWETLDGSLLLVLPSKVVKALKWSPDRVASHSTFRPVVLCCRSSSTPTPAGPVRLARESVLCIYGQWTRCRLGPEPKP